MSRSNIYFNTWRGQLYIVIILLSIVSFVSCKIDSSSNQKLSEKKVETERLNISSDYLALESLYHDMLQPIFVLKSTHPKIYWFIISWLGTNYQTPSWDGYQTDGWQEKTKKRGIDCSGFARVMQDEIFKKKIRGGSQGILNQYCFPVSVKDLTIGDLVFFQAPGSKNDRIVHVGVYLMDGYFVHATSTKSAQKGLGLNVNTLEEKVWSEDLVTGGRIKQQKK